MEQKEYKLDYPSKGEPMLILPICAAAALLHGEVFGWLSGLDVLDERSLLLLNCVYWGAVLYCTGLGFWRLIRTIHAVPAGLEYRVLGRTRRIIPWTDFSCAIVEHARQQKRNMLYLIPKSCGEPPDDKPAQHRFLTCNYYELRKLFPTKHNIQAIGEYLEFI